VADGSRYVPITQLRARPGLHPDDLDYHHGAPIEAWDRDYTRWRFNTTRVQRKFMVSGSRLTGVPLGLNVVRQELNSVPCAQWRNQEFC
jgi:hypothetical protein